MKKKPFARTLLHRVAAGVVGAFLLGSCVEVKGLLPSQMSETFQGCLAGTAASSSTALIKFEFPAKAHKVTIYRNGIPFFSTTQPSTLETTDTGLAAGSTYRYNCEATFAEGPLFGATELSVDIPEGDSVPDAEICKTATQPQALSAKVSFEWPASATKITLRRNGTPFWSTTDRGVTEHVDASLAAGSSYQYTCEALYPGNVSKLGTKDLYVETGSQNQADLPNFNGCLTGSALSTTSTRLTFEFPTGAQEVVLTRNGIPFYATRNPATLTTDDLGLLPGTSYRYNCKAIFSGGREKFGSRELNVTTQDDGTGNTVIPDFDGCVASGSVALNASQIKVRYQYPAQATSMTIFRDGVSVYTATRTTNLANPSAVLERTDSGLSEGANYTYTCQAAFPGGRTKFGTVSLALTTISTNAPSFSGATTLSVLATTVTPKRSVRLSWNVPASAGVPAQSFKVYYNRGTSVDFSLPPKATVDSSIYQYVAASLGDELTYSFAVRACATGTYQENCATNDSATITLPDHGAPTSAGADAQKKENGVFWLRAPWAEANGGIKYRKVYQVDGSNNLLNGGVPFKTVVITDPALEVPSEWISLPALAENGVYRFIVRDSDATGQENMNTQVIVVNAGDMTPPTFNGKFTALDLATTPADRDRKLKLTFSAIDPTDAVAYNLYVASYPTNACTAGTLHETRSATALGYTNGQTVVTEISNLSPRTRYSVCVRAVDAAGNVSTNNVPLDRYTLDLTAPSFVGIQSLAYQSGPARLEATWIPSSSADIKEYRIRIWTKVGGGAAQNVQELLVSASSITCGTTCSKTITTNDYTLTDASVVYAVVNACDTADAIPSGSSNCTAIADSAALSATVPDITPPQGFPGILSASSGAERSITVTWAVPANGAQLAEYRGYAIYGYPTTAANAAAAEAAQTLLGQIFCANDTCLSSYLSDSILVADAKRTYKVYMKAVDAGSNESANLPNPATDPTVSTLDTTAPNFTSNLNAADPASGAIAVTWSAASDNQYPGHAANVLTYDVYKRAMNPAVANPFGAGFAAGSTAPTLGGGVTLLGSTLTLSYSDSSLTPGDTNAYTVCVRDASNNRRCDGAIRTKFINDVVPPAVTGFAATRIDGGKNWNVAWSMSDVGTTNPADLRVSLKRKIGTSATDWPDATSGTLLLNNSTGATAMNGQIANAADGSRIAGINAGEEQFVNYTLYVSDNANPSNQTIEHLSVLADNLAPVVTISSPANGSTATPNGSNIEIAIAGACETAYAAGNGGTAVATTVTVSGDVASPTSLACSGAGRAGTYSGTLVLTGGAGAKVVTIAQADIGGNSTSVSRTYYPPLEVLPLYATNGAQWMDYVKNDGTAYHDGTGAACAPGAATSFASCLHGGELRKVVVGDDTCTGLTITESLGAFNWECRLVDGVGATFFSTGLKADKGLKDLLLGTEPATSTFRDAGTGFRTNSVSITRSSDGVVRNSVAKTWWTNKVYPLPASGNTTVSTLSGSRNIYVGETSRTTAGYKITDAKVALVLLSPSVTLTQDRGAPAATCSLTDAGVNGGSRCLVNVGGNYVWIEGGYWEGNSTDATQGSHYIFSLTKSNFVQVRNAVARDAFTGFVNMKSQLHSRLYDLQFTFNQRPGGVGGGTGAHGVLFHSTDASTTDNRGHVFDTLRFTKAAAQGGFDRCFYGEYQFSDLQFKNITFDAGTRCAYGFIFQNASTPTGSTIDHGNILIENVSAPDMSRYDSYYGDSFFFSLGGAKTTNITIRNVTANNLSRFAYFYVATNQTGSPLSNILIENVSMKNVTNQSFYFQMQGNAASISNLTMRNINVASSTSADSLYLQMVNEGTTNWFENFLLDNINMSGGVGGISIYGKVRNGRLKNMRFSRQESRGIAIDAYGNQPTMRPNNIAIQGVQLNNLSVSAWPIYIIDCVSCTLQGITSTHNYYGMAHGVQNSVIQNVASTHHYQYGFYTTQGSLGHGTHAQYNTFANILVGGSRWNNSSPIMFYQSLVADWATKWSGALLTTTSLESAYRYGIASGGTTGLGLTLSQVGSTVEYRAAASGASDARVINASSAMNFNDAYVGWVADSVNTSDSASGSVTSFPYNATASTRVSATNAFDFFGFENSFRNWMQKGTSFSSTNSIFRGALDSAGQIADFRLSKADPAANLMFNNTEVPLPGAGADPTGNNNGAFIAGQNCPAAVRGDRTTTTNRSSGVQDTFLLNAWEIIDDEIGDNDGLCESNEACLYTPNFGAYQGHGDLQTCAFQSNGGLTGITMWGYTENGVQP